MSFSNLEYLYQHLPARFRRDDEGLFLKRFLSHFCAELDTYDQLFDTFHTQINPDTAPANFIDFWLWALFDWAWFPEWFTLAQRRSFFHNIATHYARRGTPRGIVEFLLEFGIRSRVITQPTYYEEWTLDEEGWLIDGPLVVIIQIFPGSAGIVQDQTYVEGWGLEEDALAEPVNIPTRPDIDQLLSFQQPIGHHFIIEEKIAA